MTATLPDRKTDPLVWIDLEMTGLDVETDVILEIAVFITDSSPTLAPWIPNTDSSLHLIIHYPQEVLDNMNDWCKKYHGESGLTAQVLASTVTPSMAYQKVLDFIRIRCPEARTACLAGNSVHVDRQFLQKQMPAVIDHLHYRIIDVSTIKELCRRWYPEEYQRAPTKQMVHRALDDILESIEELKFYQQSMFKPLNQRLE